MTKYKFIGLDDTYSDSITFKSQYTTCKNELSEGICTRYPNGIPMDIWEAKRNDCKFYKSLEEGK